MKDYGTAHLLDCKMQPPGQTQKLKVGFVRNSCLVSHGKETLVVLFNKCSLLAFCTDTGEEKWRVQAGPDIQGYTLGTDDTLTTDGRGQVFLCCEQREWVKVFSANGEEKGIVLKGGDQGLGKHFLICWSEATDSLIVAHVKGEQCFISCVRVPPPREKEKSQFTFFGVS